MQFDSNNHLNILVAEDNAGDVLLLKEELSELSVSTKLFVCKDGVEALDYLYKAKQSEKALIPDLILLDINMPKMSGLEVLLYLRAHIHFRHIPVAMLTSSVSQYNHEKSIALKAVEFIPKPISGDQINTLLSMCNLSGR